MYKIVFSDIDGTLLKSDGTVDAKLKTKMQALVNTELVFETDCEKNMAGIIAYYDTGDWHYMFINRDNDTGKKLINTLTADHGRLVYTHEVKEVKENVPIRLSTHIKENQLQFAYDDGDGEKPFGAPKDMKVITDENIYLGFTGAVIGICVQDMYLRDKGAYFKYLEVKNNV